MVETFTTLERDCPRCGVKQYINVNAGDYNAWIDGEGYIQNLMPYLSADEREALISGLCPTCWDKQFEVEDVEEDEYEDD